MPSLMKNISRTIRRPFNRACSMKRLQEYHSQPRSLEETVDWAMHHFGGNGYYRIKTLQIPSEILALARKVKELQPRIVVEIGTASAGTLLIWSSLASRRVITCDLQDMTVQKELFCALPPPGSQCRVTLLSGDSHSQEMVSRVEQQLAGEQADFLFIDGDHTEEGVTADYSNYRHLVRPGGLIAFHDIVASQPLPTNQVNRLWKKLKQDNDCEEFIDNPAQSGFGIGVIRV